MSVNLHIDNRTLVEQCTHGDKEALNLFYVRFAPRMMSVVRRYVNSPKDAEDVLHDGFVVAFTRLGSLREYDKLEYWLATIMRNLALQFLHNQDVVEILHEIPEVEDAPEMESMLDLDTLEQLIKKLPYGYQRVFRLAMLENKSHKEIGNLLGISPSTSSSQLFHAKMMMRRLIEEHRRQAGLLTIGLIIAFLFIFLPFREEKQPPLAINEISSDSDPENKRSGEELVIIGNEEAPVSAAAERSFIAMVEVMKPDHTGVGFPEEEIYDPESGETGVDEPETDGEVMENENYASTYIDRPLSVSVMPENVFVSLGETKDSRWSLKASVGINISNNKNGGEDLIHEELPWNNGGNDNNKEEEENGHTRGETDGFPRNRYADYRDINHKNDLPLSFSLTVGRSISDKFGLETGLTYTYLHSTFETDHAKSDCRWHYLGIPVKVNFRTIEGRRWGMYASGGVTLEIPLMARSSVAARFGQPDLYSGRFTAYPLVTANVAYGFSFRLMKRVDMFVEPSLQYRFKHKYNVPNVWTDDRIGFTLPIGFRINL